MGSYSWYEPPASIGSVGSTDTLDQRQDEDGPSTDLQPGSVVGNSYTWTKEGEFERGKKTPIRPVGRFTYLLSFGMFPFLCISRKKVG